MTKKDAIELINESLIDQDSKFKREVNALFKTKEVVDMLIQAYDMSDDNAKLSLMDATEKQFLDKFAKDSGSGDEEETETSTDSTDDFEEDGSDLDFEEDGSDLDFADGSESAEVSLSDAPEDGAAATTEADADAANPFADFGAPAQEEPSGNPFESEYWKTKKDSKAINESAKKTVLKRKVRK